MTKILMVLFFSITCSVVDAMNNQYIFFKNLTNKSLTLTRQSARLYRLDPSTKVYHELKSTTVGANESIRCQVSFRSVDVIGERLVAIKTGCLFLSQLLSAILLKGDSLCTDSSIVQGKILCGLYTDGQGDNVVLFSYSRNDMDDFIRKELTEPGMGVRLFLSE